MGELGADPYRSARLVLSLRRAGVTNNAVLSAMETVPRDRFVGQSAQSLAFENAALPIDCGQTILRPSITGLMLQLAELGDDSARVLLVGLGSGYTAALLSKLAANVFAVDRFRRLVEGARSTLDELGIVNVETAHADGLSDLGSETPFDRIILTGITDEAPAALMHQLADNGRLIEPVQQDGEQKIIVLNQSGRVVSSIETSGFQPLVPGVSQEL